MQTTITDLINELNNDFAALKANQMERADAETRANLAGKIIKAAALKLAYNQIMQHDTSIPFLEDKPLTNKERKQLESDKKVADAQRALVQRLAQKKLSENNGSEKSN